MLAFGSESKGVNRWLFLLGVWASFLEHFEAFWGRIEAIRSFAEKSDGRSSRGFKPSIEGPPVVVSGSKRWHWDRLREGYKLVWSGENFGRQPASSSPEKTKRVHHMRWLHAQAREGLEKLEKKS